MTRSLPCSSVLLPLVAALTLSACQTGRSTVATDPLPPASRAEREAARQEFEQCEVAARDDSSRKLVCKGPAMLLIQGPKDTYARGRSTLESMKPLLEDSGAGRRTNFEFGETTIREHAYPTLRFEEKGDGPTSHVHLLAWETHRKLATCATSDASNSARCDRLLEALVVAGLPERLQGPPTLRNRNSTDESDADRPPSDVQ